MRHFVLRILGLPSILVLALTVLVVPALHAAPDGIAVIVNRNNPVDAMSRTELRPIFQTNQTTWPGGSRILPLNLPEGDGTRANFDSVVLGLDPDRVTRYWIDRKIRGGARPPKKAPNPAVIIAVVSKKPEAVGYVPIGHVTKDVKVVARIVGATVQAP